MQRYLTFITLFLFFIEMNAQTRETIYLWPNEVPNETEAKQAPVQSPNTARNVTRLSKVTNPAVVVYEPEAALNNGAGIIVCPGGGYNILAIDLEGYEIAQWLNYLGFTAFVLQYRVPKNQLGALNDVQRAIRLVRSQADRWNLNKEKLGVLGFSAGGSLAARASTLFDTDSYPAKDKIDKLSARPDFSILIYPAYLDQGENRSLTPELTITDQTPPMFLFATADDKYANSSLVMAGALRDADIPVELHLLPEGGHGYGLRKGNIAGETWPGLTETWLANMLTE